MSLATRGRRLPLPSRLGTALPLSSSLLRSGARRRALAGPPTSGGTAQRVESLTGLRWWAALAVFCFHSQFFAPMPAVNGDPYFWIFGGLTGLGFAGVTFFFILSGFVLTWSFRYEDTALRFYWRRLARIWPMVPISALLSWPVFFWPGRYPWHGLLATLSLTQAWSPTYFYDANRNTWSLSCEAFFYLLFPLLIRPILALSLRALAVVSVPLLLVITTAPPLFSAGQAHAGTPLYRLPEFILGIVTAAAMRRGWRPSISPKWVTAAIGAAGAFLWWWFKQPLLAKAASTPSPFWTLQNWIWHFPLHKDAVPPGPQQVMDEIFGPLFALLIAAVAARDLSGGRSWLRSRPLVRLGKWSFSFYLVEMPVLCAAAKWIGVRPPQTVQNIPWLLAALAVAIALSAFCYRWIETPAERWMRKLLRPTRSTATDLVAAEYAEPPMEVGAGAL